MSRLGVVIFGATGFTGKHAALEMVTLAKKHPGLTWGVAGRSQSKLEDLMQDISKTTGEDLSQIKMITADVFDEESLQAMCWQAKVVANCCGPYRTFGEPVVKAALHARTHYVDVTGEPQFIETMQLKYDSVARSVGVYVVSACGFDSIPNDMGVVFLQQNFGGTVNSVESYMSSEIPPEYNAEARKYGTVHYGTWESLVLGLAHWNELKPIRQSLYPDKLPTFNPKLTSQGILHSKNKQWFVPFPGADSSVVYRTQRHFYSIEQQRPVQFKVYWGFQTFFQALMAIVGAAFLALMARFCCTRDMLLKHPRLFSGGLVTNEGPTEAVTKNSSFSVTLYGKGWNEGTDVTKPMDKAVVAKVSGKNPGYGATVVGLLYSAITLLTEADNIPEKGGVLTTGVAFKNTNLIKHLNENRFKFEIVESAAI